MLINQRAIKTEQKWLTGCNEDIVQKCESCYIGSDPTRLKILYLLKKHKQLCVTDLAGILKVGVSAVSHQLSLLERFEMVSKVRMGKHACYSLGKKSKEFFS